MLDLPGGVVDWDPAPVRERRFCQTCCTEGGTTRSKGGGNRAGQTLRQCLSHAMEGRVFATRPLERCSSSKSSKMSSIHSKVRVMKSGITYSDQ